MRKVVLYIAVSLDHCIARPDGDVSWLNSPDFALPGEDFGYHEMYNSIDAVVMGHNTYREILGFDVPYPYSDKANYVLANSEVMNREELTEVISRNAVDRIRSLKSEEGKDIWLVGGAAVNGLMLSNQLIDRIILTVVPITLGEGIPLFAGATGDAHFDLTSCESYKNGFVQLTYDLILLEER